jgi:hypothetical protein
VARDQVQHLQPRVVGATAAHPGRHLLQTHMAVLLLHHPVGDRSALPGSARVSLSTGSQSPVGHPQETRKGKFEGGGRPSVLEATKRAPIPLPVPLRSHRCTPAQAHQDQSPPRRQHPRSSSAPERQEGSSERPFPRARPGPVLGAAAPPRVHPPGPGRRSNRSGTYCASAERLPRPLSPRQRRGGGGGGKRADPGGQRPARGTRGRLRAARSGPVEAPRSEHAVTRAARTTPPARPAPGGGRGRGLRCAPNGARCGHSRRERRRRAGCTGRTAEPAPAPRPLHPKYSFCKYAPAASLLPTFPRLPRPGPGGGRALPQTRLFNAAKAGRWAGHCSQPPPLPP